MIDVGYNQAIALPNVIGPKDIGTMSFGRESR
jgi:hypothetical protein